MEDVCFGIELKYKTKRLSTHIGGELFKLKHQSAQDVGRYDFLSDLMRIEGLLEANHLHHGFVIFLTNDSGYWEDSGQKDRVDEDFRIHKSRTISGHLSWSNHAAEGTKKGQEETISISDSYVTNWSPYSEIKKNPFRYLLFEAKSGNGDS